MKQLALTLMLIGGALLSSYSSQAQGRRDHDNRGYGYGGGDRRDHRYEREYRGHDYYRGRGPRGVYYGGGYGGYDCRPVETVVYEAPCPPPPPPRRVYYSRGPRVVIATGPIVVGF